MGLLLRGGERGREGNVREKGREGEGRGVNFRRAPISCWQPCIGLPEGLTGTA